MSAFIFVKLNRIVMWRQSAAFPHQAALKTVLPCHNNVTLTKINADMMLIVMYCLTERQVYRTEIYETNGCLDN